MSFTPKGGHTFRPFWPIVEVIRSSSVRAGGKKKPRSRLSFRDTCVSKAIIRWKSAGQWIHVRSDVIGDPFSSPVWALVHEVIDQNMATQLIKSEGYKFLEDGKAVLEL